MNGAESFAQIWPRLRRQEVFAIGGNDQSAAAAGASTVMRGRQLVPPANAACNDVLRQAMAVVDIDISEGDAIILCK